MKNVIACSMIAGVAMAARYATDTALLRATLAAIAFAAVGVAIAMAMKATRRAV